MEQIEPNPPIEDKIINKSEHEYSIILEIQRYLKEVIGNKVVVLIDATLEEDKKVFEIGKSKLEKLPKLKNYYFSRFNYNEMCTSSLYKILLGKDIRLSMYSILDNENIFINHDVGLIIFSGSSADVTTALQAPNREIFSTKISHGEVFSNMSGIYKEAQVQSIPIFASCYGHHVISYINGLHIRNTGVFTTKNIQIEIEQSINKLLNPQNLLQKGTIPYYHGEVVEGTSNIDLFEYDNHPIKSINHGGIFFDGEKYEYLNDALTAGVSFSLSIQGHPEYALLEPLFTAVFSESQIAYSENNSLTPSILMILSNLLNTYNSRK